MHIQPLFDMRTWLWIQHLLGQHICQGGKPRPEMHINSEQILTPSLQWPLPLQNQRIKMHSLPGQVKRRTHLFRRPREIPLLDDRPQHHANKQIQRQNESLRLLPRYLWRICILILVLSCDININVNRTKTGLLSRISTCSRLSCCGPSAALTGSCRFWGSTWGLSQWSRCGLIQCIVYIV